MIRGVFLMALNKRSIIEQELNCGKTVREISQEHDISKSYAYHLQRKTKKTSGKLLDVTTMIKKSSVNDFYLKGIHIKCNDEVLIKVVKVLIDD